jgi:Domain of unknown function (DUF4483)
MGEYTKGLNSQSSKNVLLVKASIGKPKPSTRKLPEGDYAYGKIIKPDPEGVGALISSWAEHKSTSIKKSDKDFKKLNILSTVEGACTASKQSKFRQNNNLRLKSATQKYKFKVPDIVFGIENKPSTPIKAVINNLFAEQPITENPYNNAPGSPKNFLPIAKTTRATEKRSQAVKNSLSAFPKEMFKIKRFTNVQSKTSTRRTP